MNELQLLETRSVLDNQMNIYGTTEEPLFLAKEVAQWIEHTDLSRMVDLVDEAETYIIHVRSKPYPEYLITRDGFSLLVMATKLNVLINT